MAGASLSPAHDAPIDSASQAALYVKSLQTGASKKTASSFAPDVVDMLSTSRARASHIAAEEALRNSASRSNSSYRIPRKVSFSDDLGPPSTPKSPAFPQPPAPKTVRQRNARDSQFVTGGAPASPTTPASFSRPSPTVHHDAGHNLEGIRSLSQRPSSTAFLDQSDIQDRLQSMVADMIAGHLGQLPLPQQRVTPAAARLPADDPPLPAEDAPFLFHAGCPVPREFMRLATFLPVKSGVNSPPNLLAPVNIKIPNQYWVTARDKCEVHMPMTLVNPKLPHFRPDTGAPDNRTERQRERDAEDAERGYPDLASMMLALTRHMFVQWILDPLDPMWLIYLLFWQETVLTRYV